MFSTSQIFNICGMYLALRVHIKSENENIDGCLATTPDMSRHLTLKANSWYNQSRI